MKIEMDKKTANREVFENLRFVCRARSTKYDSTYALAHILVEPDALVATDGRRLHRMTYENQWTPGLYEVLTCSRTKIVLLLAPDAGVFPNYRVVIPKHKQYFQVETDSDSASMEIVCATLAAQDWFGRHTFMADALFPERTTRVYFGDRDRPILIETDSTQAVVMPFMVKRADIKTKAADEVQDEAATETETVTL